MGDAAIPNTGDPRVDAAWARIRGKFSDLEDAAVIHAHLEKRASERLKEHAELAASHDEWMKHMQDKLDALTDIVMRREGGSEARL